jgi:Legume lectin domain/Abnormal spindle-like microcephaly-assoc'd, ASPM-SPD-2-Hydin
MQSKLRFGVLAVSLLIAFTGLMQSLSAQSFTFPVAGFTSTNVCTNSATPPPACQVFTNGSPTQPSVTSAGVLRLTAARLNQHGSAWFSVPQPLSTGFTTAFQFQISNTNSCLFCTFPADGLALVIQNDPAGTGALGYTGDGQNLAYGNNDVSTASGPGKAIKNSIAIELDTHQNSDYSDPDGNHIAVQSCGPNNASTLTPNSADHNYVCPDGNLAKLALQSLPAGVSLSDGTRHTITVNYLPPGTCTSSCNNLSVYLDSTLLLQATLDITKQLNLNGNGGAYIGFTAATGAVVENNDIVSWSFSSLPLAPITINQPLQTTTTNFNYTPNLSAITDYSQSGLPLTAFTGLFMQGTVQTITDDQYTALVTNTPFQGTTCQHQDTGSGNFGCVITTDLCTNPTSSTPSGANCPNTGTNALINVSNTYLLDPSQKPIVAPGYIMGKDTALTCLSTDDNTCKGLVNIFTSISGDPSVKGHTNSFNSILFPILGVVQPSTSATTTPPLNSGWINGPVTVNLKSIETVPNNNSNPPNPLPTVTGITYSATGANLPSPVSGTLPGATGSVAIPGAVEGTTVLTYSATDSAGTPETTITNTGNTVSSASPSLTIMVDLTPPTVSCTPPAVAWQATDVTVPCTAADNVGGSGLVGPSSFSLQTSVPSGSETSTASIPAVSVQDIAGNTASAGPFGPFEVDKKPPTITGPSISPSSPVFGQSVTANYSCGDQGSGVVVCGPSASVTFPATANAGPFSSPAPGSAGSHTFTVYSQDAVGNQSPASTVSYSVAQATPTITWPTPAPIVLGTLLSGTQLNASANVQGSFSYTPGAGTVLPAGLQTLSVVFTPSDNTDYTQASSQVSLLVTQPLISFNPGSLNLGNVTLGSVIPTTVVVTNIGNAPLRINKIALLTGVKDNDEFAINSSCKTAVAPGKTCSFVVTFTALRLGPCQRTLFVYDNVTGSPQGIPITLKVVKP